MICKKCKKTIPDDALFCCYCGKNLQPQFPKAKKRANGEGSVYKVSTGNYKAVVVLGYKDDDFRKPIRKTKSGFKTKSEAVAYLPKLKQANLLEKPAKSVTLLQGFESWITTQGLAENTKSSYRYNFNALKPLHNRKMETISLQEVQELISRPGITQNQKKIVRNVVRALWKYALPREWVVSTINIGEYLEIGKVEKKKPKQGFSKADFEKIAAAVGRVEFADVIYIMCLTGFRISELLSLKHESYDPVEKTLKGGLKTEAGRDRIVPVSPKIQPYIEERYKARTEYLFTNPLGLRLEDNAFRIRFHLCLTALQIDYKTKGYTPHTCRHTFADLLKNVDGADKDKLALIGHKDASMLLYYQSSSMEGLKDIISKL